jgi:hypothetical protein
MSFKIILVKVTREKEDQSFLHQLWRIISRLTRRAKANEVMDQMQQMTVSCIYTAKTVK